MAEVLTEQLAFGRHRYGYGTDGNLVRKTIWIADLGPELVVNGSFTTDITSWIVQDSTAIWDSGSGGRAKVTATGAVPAINQTLIGVLDIGATYYVTANPMLGNTADKARVSFGTGLSGIIYPGGAPVQWVATNGNFIVSCDVASSSAFGSPGDFAYFNGISVRKVL